jgi:hypothetical protein
VVADFTGGLVTTADQCDICQISYWVDNLSGNKQILGKIKKKVFFTNLIAHTTSISKGSSPSWTKSMDLISKKLSFIQTALFTFLSCHS